MCCFSLYNLSTSDVTVTAVKARANWHILFCRGQLWFCKFPSSEWTVIFLNPRFPPAPFFHKAMWERQVLWGCERIYSFSQKKIGRHPPPRLTVSRVCLTPEEIDASKLNGGPQWLRRTGRRNIFNPFPQSRHVNVVSIKTNRGLRLKQALWLTHLTGIQCFENTPRWFGEFRNGLTQYCSIRVWHQVLLITTSRVIPPPTALFLDKDRPLKRTVCPSGHKEDSIYFVKTNVYHARTEGAERRGVQSRRFMTAIRNFAWVQCSCCVQTKQFSLCKNRVINPGRWEWENSHLIFLHPLGWTDGVFVSFWGAYDRDLKTKNGVLLH